MHWHQRVECPTSAMGLPINNDDGDGVFSSFSFSTMSVKAGVDNVFLRVRGRGLENLFQHTVRLNAVLRGSMTFKCLFQMYTNLSTSSHVTMSALATDLVGTGDDMQQSKPQRLQNPLCFSCAGLGLRP